MRDDFGIIVFFIGTACPRVEDQRDNREGGKQTCEWQSHRSYTR